MEFLRKLHQRMFGDTWQWAGIFRTTRKNMGVQASQIPEATMNLLENTKRQVGSGTLQQVKLPCDFTINW